jgi:hypothetical protein
VRRATPAWRLGVAGRPTMASTSVDSSAAASRTIANGEISGRFVMAAC